MVNQSELDLVRFLERQGYDVSYTTDVDTDQHPTELLTHRLVVIAGHDEYQSGAQRTAYENARAAGVNLAFLGGDIGDWQIRYEDNHRTIVEYRSGSADPEPDPALKTDRFVTLSPPRPPCQLLGVQYMGSRSAIHSYATVGNSSHMARGREPGRGVNHPQRGRL